MSATREFHIGDILTITTGALVSPDYVDGIYAICNFMTGDSLMTHQLPRACDECAPSLRLQHPDLAAVTVPEFTGEDHVWSWLAEQVAQFGERREVAPLRPEDHTYIDPITELRAMAPHAEIIPVVMDEGGAA